MRLVHLSDFHLGYRQYQRLTPTGINQREADVAGTFKRAIDQVIAIRPEIVLIAGDVFHTSRPSNAAILHAFRQFLKLRTELPETKIVMAAGDHDTPRTSESGSIMGLFEQIGISVAAAEAKRFLFEDLGVAVLAVPDVPGGTPILTADDRAAHNLLVMHANLNDVVPQYYADLDRSTTRLSRADLHLERWSYVALGHYHVHQKVAENAYYSGSLDYTSLNVWYDLSEEHPKKRKGFVEFDLDTRKATFHSVAPSRDFLDLDPINARDMTPAEVDAIVARTIERVRGGIADKIVRLVIRDIPRQVSRELDHRVIREYKRQALSFILDARKPESTRRDAAGAPARRPSVVDVVREQLSARQMPPDLDRGRLVELGMKYLNDADAFPVAAASAPEVTT
ncbi:MAG TPA: exonuclease SbcCD subunit D [Gemmatimonadaceae bacterium]|nr:exonuclease SbcCD subunit D [Gemmatimonadaceae bacterium]